MKKVILVIMIVCLSFGTSFALIGQGWVQNGAKMANIRKLAGLKATKYNVVQGSCCDGHNMFYFVFMNKKNEHIKIVKMKYVNDKFVFISKSPAFYSYHGNDIAYISNLGGINGNDKLFITNLVDGFTNHITVFDVKTMQPDNMEIVCRYWKNYSECQLYNKGNQVYNPDKLRKLINEKHGFSSIAYDNTSGRLLVGLASKHDLMTFRISYDEGYIELIPTSYIIQSRTESTFQGIDCDYNYIYSCWSPKRGVSTVNRVYKYNWQGKKIKKYDIDKTYELESVSHIGSMFYGAYHHSHMCHWTAKKKVKVKVKKVWNKAHTKKIWKYRIKTKKVKRSQFRREAYVKKLRFE